MDVVCEGLWGAGGVWIGLENGPVRLFICGKVGGMGMNKGVLILGGIIVLAVIVMFALKAGESGDTQQEIEDSGGGVEASDAGGESAVVQQSEAVKTQVESKVKTEIKKPLLPKAVRSLTPEETVQAFMATIWAEEYDKAMEYVSPENRYFESKMDLIEYRKAHGYQVLAGNLKEIKFRRVEYSDKSQTMVKVRFELYTDKESDYIYVRTMELQKENDVWKIFK